MPRIVTRRTFEIGDAQITVRNSTAWIMADAETVHDKLVRAMGKDADDNGVPVVRVDDIAAGRIAKFVMMVCNTETVDGYLGFPWPAPGAPAMELVAGLQAVGDCLDVGELELWLSEIRAADEPPGDSDLFPGREKKASAQKD